MGGARDARIAQPAEKTNGKCGEGKKQVSPDCEYHLVCPPQAQTTTLVANLPAAVEKMRAPAKVPFLPCEGQRVVRGPVEIYVVRLEPPDAFNQYTRLQPEDTRETARRDNAAFERRFRSGQSRR